jgi:uncharacterized protein YecT (DUF1311 family)
MPVSVRLMRDFIRLSVSLGCAFGALLGVSAQTPRSTTATAEDADQQLNKTYQQVMQRLAPKSRTQLRDAQRAWLAFVERDSAAACAAAGKLGKTDQDCEEFKVDGFEHRTGELSNLLEAEPNAIYRWDDKTKNEREVSKSELAVLLPRMDPELNIVYQRCLHLLSEDAAVRLRDAQRAWIAFRDALRPFGVSVVYQTTAYRIHQLSDFYVGEGLEPQPYNAEKADSSVPDPFERAR